MPSVRKPAIDGCGEVPSPVSLTHLLALVGVADITEDGEALDTESFGFGRRVFDLLGGSRRADNVGAGFGKGQGTSASDPTTGSGHHGDFAIHPETIQQH